MVGPKRPLRSRAGHSVHSAVTFDTAPETIRPLDVGETTSNLFGRNKALPSPGTRSTDEDKPMWDERYSAESYVFGTEPAAFLRARANLLEPGQTALAVADGEGRNSVFLAEKGLSVTAMDASSVGIEKAKRLATERGVTIDFQLADIHDWTWTPEAYDLVVAVFIQFLSPAERPAIFRGMAQTLRPGGRLLLHGYRPEQVDYGTGGPPHRENMYTEAQLREDFRDLQIEELVAYDAVIEEGHGHSGRSALVDLVARKP